MQREEEFRRMDRRHQARYEDSNEYEEVSYDYHFIGWTRFTGRYGGAHRG